MILLISKVLLSVLIVIIPVVVQSVGLPILKELTIGRESFLQTTTFELSSNSMIVYSYKIFLN